MGYCLFTEAANAAGMMIFGDVSSFNSLMMFDFPKWIVIVAFAVLLLAGVKFAPRGKFHEDALSLENSKCIQGFAAVGIVLHHLTQYYSEKSIFNELSFFSEIGVFFVGIFFFFSGYGLYSSLMNKENYLKGFLKKRLITVLVPFYVVNLVFVLSSLLNGNKMSLTEFFAALSGWILTNSHMWYIVEIVILYIVFYLVYRFIKNRNTATVVMSVFVIAMIIGSLLLGHGADMSCRFWFQGEWWYNASLLFIVGILAAKHRTRILEVVRKLYRVLLPISAGLAVFFYIFTEKALREWSYWNEYPGHPGYKEKFLTLAFQLPFILFAVITVILIMLKVKFGNRVLKFLGTVSLELYLIHNLFLNGLLDGTILRVKSEGLLILLTFVLSIAAAYALNGIDRYIIGLINGRIRTVNPEAKRINSFSIIKLIMAFLVVTIHFPLRNGGDYFVAFGKTAVPVFFVISGYLLFRDDSKEMMQRLWKQTKRIFLITVISNAAYALYCLITEGMHIFGVTYFTEQRIRAFLLYNVSPFSEHLWFLGSMLYALLIIMLLTKLKILKKVMYAAPLLILTYMFLSWNDPMEPFAYRNALLIALPYLSMGMLVRRYEDKLMKIKAPFYWIAALILCVTTVLEIRMHTFGTGVPFISTEILTYVIVLLCLKYKDFGKNTIAERLGRQCTLFVYIAHIMIGLIIIDNTPANIGLFSKYGAITAFVISLILAVPVKLFILWVKKKCHR